jgi:4-hydroxy-tetrahydrodipicolinate reductase
MKIGVSAITGKMGLTIAKMVHQHNIAELFSGLVRKGNNFNHQDLGMFLGYEKSGRNITDNIHDFIQNCEAIIDFSTPELSLELAKTCSQYHKIFICGTTGFSESEKSQLVNYSQSTPIIWSANMSLGVNLLLNLVELTSKILREDFDAEILEMHHNKKVDSPSGTALALGKAIAYGRDTILEEVASMVRFDINKPRKKGEIGFATLRGGDVVGDHTVIFAGEGERIELSHKASKRDIFASGAIRAAIWASNKKSGFFSMRDVLSLSK